MINKKLLIISVLLGAISIIGVSGYFISKAYQGEQIKLDNKLIVGTYKISQTNLGDNSFNRIYIEIIENDEVKYQKSFTTDDKSLVRNEKYPTCVFVDLSEEMNKYTVDNSVKEWCESSSSNNNYIKVKTEFILGGFISEEIKLFDSGLYLINIPKEDGDLPQVEHAYIYERSKVRW